MPLITPEVLASYFQAPPHLAPQRRPGSVAAFTATNSAVGARGANAYTFGAAAAAAAVGAGTVMLLAGVRLPWVALCLGAVLLVAVVHVLPFGHLVRVCAVRRFLSAASDHPEARDRVVTAADTFIRQVLGNGPLPARPARVAATTETVIADLVQALAYQLGWVVLGTNTESPKRLSHLWAGVLIAADALDTLGAVPTPSTVYDDFALTMARGLPRRPEMTAMLAAAARARCSDQEIEALVAQLPQEPNARGGALTQMTAQLDMAVQLLNDGA